MVVKDIGAQRVEQGGNHLMGKPSHAKQRNCSIRTGHEPNRSRTDHHQRSKYNTDNPGIDKLQLENFHHERRQITAEYPAEVCGQEWQPGEDGDFFQIHVSHSGQIKRNPEIKGLPSRLSKEAWNRNSPKFGVGENLFYRRSSVGAICRFIRFLTLLNI